LLRTTDKHVSEICWRCGFTTLSAFNRQFRTQTGTTPSAYRRKLGSGESSPLGSGTTHSSPPPPAAPSSTQRQRTDAPPHAIIEQVNAALKVEPWHTRLPGNSTPTAPGPHRPRDREGRSRETISRARPGTISGTRPECGPGAQRRPPDGAESSGALAAGGA